MVLRINNRHALAENFFLGTFNLKLNGKRIPKLYISITLHNILIFTCIFIWF